MTNDDGLGVLAITHYARLLTELRPDRVHVLLAGRVVLTGGPELADRLEETGYEGIAAELGVDALTVEMPEERRSVLGPDRRRQPVRRPARLSDRRHSCLRSAATSSGRARPRPYVVEAVLVVASVATTALPSSTLATKKKPTSLPSSVPS